MIEGAEQAVAALAKDYSLLLITKGDLLHQQKKVDDSGLAGYFQGIEIVSEKSASVYQEIMGRWQVDPARFLMIGNSMRSDVLPVLSSGGWAVHLAGHMTWDHEHLMPDDLPADRFFEVESIANVPELIGSILGAESRSSNGP